MRAVALIAVFLLACGASETEDEIGTDVQQPPHGDVIEPVETGPVSRLVVVQTMGFTREEPKGVAPGFDLDGRVSEKGDLETCGHGDYTAPDGTPGIDNMLATLVPLFDLVGLAAAEGLIQSIIDEGGILILIQVDGIDDPENDDQVTLTVRAGQGVPLLGTDGLLLSGQTFALNPESPESTAQSASITDGVLEAGPFEARLPIRVFGVDYELTLHNARIRATWTEDGDLKEGLLGGGVETQDLYTIGEKAAADDASVLAAIEVVVEDAGDLAPDSEGVCRQISGTFQFGAVSAFLFPEE